MTCPTCKNKILDPYELNGVEYCCPNCAYNRDEKFRATSRYEELEKTYDKATELLSKIDENKTN